MSTQPASPNIEERMSEIWHFQAGPLFKEFTALLGDPSKSIPAKYLQSQWDLGKHWNHLFKFLRPSKVAAMLSFLDNMPANRRKKFTENVLTPYRDAWSALLDALGRFYGKKSTIGPVVTHFSSVMRFSDQIGTDPNRRERTFDTSLYAKFFDDFRLAFASLPTESGAKAAKIDKDIGKVLKIAKAKATSKFKFVRTQTDVAQDLGVSKQTIISWEKKELTADGKKTNKWDYVRSLRSAENKEAYELFLKLVNAYKLIKKHNPKHPYSFIKYRDDFLMEKFGTTTYIKKNKS